MKDMMWHHTEALTNYAFQTGRITRDDWVVTTEQLVKKMLPVAAKRQRAKSVDFAEITTIHTYPKADYSDLSESESSEAASDNQSSSNSSDPKQQTTSIEPMTREKTKEEKEAERRQKKRD